MAKRFFVYLRRRATPVPLSTNRTVSFTYLGNSHTLTEPKSYYDSYNWTNFKLYPITSNGGAGVFDMYGSFLTPFTYTIEGGVFKISIDGNNVAPGHEEYFGIKEYVGTYDALSDAFSVTFMLNDYEQLMQFNTNRIYPIYATANEMKLYGTYISYAENGYEQFKIVSYGNGRCDLYIGDAAYTDLYYTANGNRITIDMFSMPIYVSIKADGTLSGDVFGTKATFTYVDEVRDPNKLPSREDV